MPDGRYLLDDTPLTAPWVEPCDGCAGTGVTHAAIPLPGPCAFCWGSGRVLFAFDPDNLPSASCVPPSIAQPWMQAPPPPPPPRKGDRRAER